MDNEEEEKIFEFNLLNKPEEDIIYDMNCIYNINKMILYCDLYRMSHILIQDSIKLINTNIFKIWVYYMLNNEDEYDWYNLPYDDNELELDLLSVLLQIISRNISDSAKKYRTLVVDMEDNHTEYELYEHILKLLEDKY